MRNYFEFAIENIIKYGDTDIFPYPIENHIFYDKKKEVVDILVDMFDNFENYLIKCPPINESMLVSSGYTGFRWATQLDPIWNAFFLGITLSISEKIEENRISTSSNKVFSYRIKLNKENYTIFDKNFGWNEFYNVSINKAKDYKYVLICDISHFYTNIYHHRLENSIAKLDIKDKRAEKYIMKFLQNFSSTKSYGLPIGCQASRILAELLLNRTDKLLRTKGVEFCRFVDDYHIFANSEEELYGQLLYLSKILIDNEGLLLQKSKTRIISSDEFIKTSKFSSIQENNGTNDKESDEMDIDKDYTDLFSISLRYDPYSLTAEEDYESLKEELNKINIIGLLSKELNKSRVHSAVMKKIISSIKYLDNKLIDEAILSLIDNIDILLPVFPNLMILISKIFDKLKESTQNEILELIRTMIKKKHYIMQIQLNLAYAIRILAKKYSDENEDLLINLYNNEDSILIKKDILTIMIKWESDFWISDLKNRYNTLTEWEKRIFIMASYILKDEGKHWRDYRKREFSAIDLLYRDWMADKVSNGRVIDL